MRMPFFKPSRRETPEQTRSARLEGCPASTSRAGSSPPTTTCRPSGWSGRRNCVQYTVNYNIRLLGRAGVMNAVLVSDPTALENDIRAFKTTLAGFSFDPGERYSEYRAGDKIAEYGLTGLIVGGAAAAAAKTGAFKFLGKFAMIIISAIGFWAVALLIAMIDSAVLLSAGEYTFLFHADGRIELRLPRSPYLVRNCELVFTLVTHFLRPFHLSSIESKMALQPDKLLALRCVDAIQRVCSWLAAATFILIVIVGPVVSAAWGVNLALVYVLPILYVNSIAALVYISRRRADLRLATPDLWRLAFELLACPALTINIVKRLTMRRNLVLNTWELAGKDADLRARINANLELFDAPVAAR
jgi:hypothetical protein